MTEKNRTVCSFNHDYCHCKNDSCSKKLKCYRYKLYLEDKAWYGGWCWYGGMKEDGKGNCEHYMPIDRT